MKPEDDATDPGRSRSAEPDPPFKVDDRRHWAREERSDDDPGEPAASAEPVPPSLVDEYRRKAEESERRLLEYIAAFKRAQDEQARFRERLERDVERRTDLKFGGLVEELLACVDDLDLALVHAPADDRGDSVARGVRLARDRFLSALSRSGVERFEVVGEPFDPNVAEAVRLDPVADPARDGTVVETLRAGYRLGERVLRAPRVAVGRLER